MAKQTGNMMFGGHFIGQWEWEHLEKYNHIKGVREAYDTALSLASEAEAKHTALSLSGMFTDSGLKAEMAGWLAKEGAAKLAKLDRLLRSARNTVQDRTAKLYVKAEPTDKQDVAAAMLRSELRAYVKGLSASQRTALLVAPDIDPAILGAIAEAPSVLSGITDHQLADVKGRLAVAANPEVAAQLDAMKDAIEVADNARRAAVKEMAKATKTSEGEIERMMRLAAGEAPESAFSFSGAE